MVIISVACAHFAPQATTNMSVMENIENPTTNPNNLPGFGASKTQEAVPTTQDNAEKAAPATNNAEKVSDKFEPHPPPKEKEISNGNLLFFYI